MKLEDGDAFERENADWLRERLPTYEKLWSEFIGNDGTAHPLELGNLAKDQQSSRRQFYQAHYSMAISARRFESLLENLDALAAATATLPSVQEQFDLLFCLMARLGHVRDMVAKMDTALGMKGGAANRMQEFYDKRSHVIHGPQIPFEVRDGIIFIPKIAGRNEQRDEWSSHGEWEEVNPQKFVSLWDFCHEVGKEAFELLAAVHEQIYSAAKVKYSGCKLAPPDSTSERLTRFKALYGESANQSPLSGSNISGQYW